MLSRFLKNCDMSVGAKVLKPNFLLVAAVTALIASLPVEGFSAEVVKERDALEIASVIQLTRDLAYPKREINIGARLTRSIEYQQQDGVVKAFGKACMWKSSAGRAQPLALSEVLGKYRDHCLGKESGYFALVEAGRGFCVTGAGVAFSAYWSERKSGWVGDSCPGLFEFEVSAANGGSLKESFEAFGGGGYYQIVEQFALDEGVALAASGDMEQLYASWLLPIFDFASATGALNNIEFSAIQASVDSGFARFCELSGGEERQTDGVKARRSDIVYPGRTMRCRVGSTEIGFLQYYLDERSTLKIGWSSDKRKSDLAKAQEEGRDARLALAKSNGPAGWIETQSGKYRVVRFGSMEEPYYPYFDRHKPDDIESVDWGSANVRLRMRDGSVVKIDETRINSQKYDRLISSFRPYAAFDFPVVVEDASSGALIELRFPKYEGIRRVTFDAPDVWKEVSRESVDRRIAEGRRTQAGSSRSGVSRDGFQLGQKVCMSQTAVAETPTGIYVRGEPQYRKRTGTAFVQAFVERIEEAKLQLRVSGLYFEGERQGRESIESHNYSGSQLRPNSIFWDDAFRWTRCD